MTLKNAFGSISLEATQQRRLGGGKTAYTATVSTSGDTTIRVPDSGKSITLYWVYAITDNTGGSNPIIQIKLGSTEVYRMIGGLAHWEPFVGAPDEPLVVNLSTSGTNVVFTFHITET